MSWGSQGAVWPAVAGSIARNNLEEIRLAMEERFDAADQSMPAALSTSFFVGEITRERLQDVYDGMTTLMFSADYGDYQNSGGDWEDLVYSSGGSVIVDVCPAWTTASQLLAYTGEGSRYAVPAVGYTYKSWVNQQYNFLNLLRWRRRHRYGAGAGTGSLTIDYDLGKQGTDAVFATALAEWLADPPNVTDGGNSFYGGQSLALSGGIYDLISGRCDFSLSTGSALNHDVEIYASMGYASAPSTSVYKDEVFGTLDRGIYSLVTQTAQTGDDSHSWISESVFAMDAADAVNNKAVGFNIEGVCLIQKWDVSGGFSFIA
jgi:hypothetical protein